MTRQVEISQQTILDHQAVGSIAGVSGGFMSQYLAMARVIAVQDYFPEYQAMALKATRLPGGAVRVEVPADAQPIAAQRPAAPANVMKTADVADSRFAWFMSGLALTAAVWAIVEIIKHA